jgi:MFS transporter, ACS family, solute carrier family 17 (sodium-dependent inorganic phosphate cotransporter), other
MSAASPVPASRRRHVVVAFTVAAMFLAYTDRVNLAVAVVAMREQFHWSQSVKGLVLAGFFIGYFLFQVASGSLAQRFGGKRVLGLAVLWWSLFALLTPPAARVSVAVLVGARIGLGLGEAAVLPGSYELFSRWVPAAERTRSLALFLSGIPLGQIVGLVATGYLTARLGWPATFYVFGALGLVWAGAFWRSVHNSPAGDARVSAGERALLPAAAAGAAAPMPWRRLLHSPLVLSFIAAHFCHNWALYVLISWLPSYFHEHLGLSVQQSGWYSALPWLANFLALLVGGGVADAAVTRAAGPLGVRRALAATGLGGAALCLLSLPGAGSAEVALGIACAAAGCIGLACAGFTAVPLDITPRHAPMLIGFSNTLATIPGIVAVALTGWQLDVTHNYTSTFVLSAGIAAAGALLLAATAHASAPEL